MLSCHEESDAHDPAAGGGGGEPTLPPEEQYRWEDDIEADVREECGKHGVVEDAFIDRSLSAAWVRFADTESAARAAAVMRDKYFDGRRVVVEYKDESAMTAAVQAGRG